MRLRDKVILVTGGTTGIGGAISERSVAEGAQVLVHGVDRSEGEALVARLGSRAVLHVDDLVDPASPERIVQAAVAAFGRIDAVVNNAAIVPRSTIETTSAALFDRTMAINVRAPLLILHWAFPFLKERRGCVLNIGSINALSGEATLLDYSISKGALQTLSRNLANAHTLDQVRVNHFNVGWVLSPREYRHQMDQGMPPDWPEHVPPVFAPSGRLIRPEEIATAAVYWLSDESRPITGSVIDLEQFSLFGRNPVKT